MAGPGFALFVPREDSAIPFLRQQFKYQYSLSTLRSDGKGYLVLFYRWVCSDRYSFLAFYRRANNVPSNPLLLALARRADKSVLVAVG